MGKDDKSPKYTIEPRTRIPSTTVRVTKESDFSSREPKQYPPKDTKNK